MSKRAIFRLIIIAVAIAVAFLVYRFFFVAGGEAVPGVESLAGAPAGPGPADDEFFKLLERVKGIELNAEAVFNHPVWESLENFRRPLLPEPAGRRNPFLPPGLDGFAGSGTSTATTTRGR